MKKIENVTTVIFDLNGTLYEKGIPVKGAIETIQTLRSSGVNLGFVTNTDSRSIKDVHQRLIKMGFDIKLEEVFTPVTAAKIFVEENHDLKYYPLVHDEVFEDLGISNICSLRPDYVIIGDFCDKVSYEEINKVFRMIKNGAKIIAMSKTLWYVDSDGLSINTGAFVKMFEEACGVESLLLGKPSKEFLRLALRRTNSKAVNTIFVGDDIETDVLGAKLINGISVQVKTGVFDKSGSLNSSLKPDYIIDDVNGVLDFFNLY